MPVPFAVRVLPAPEILPEMVSVLPVAAVRLALPASATGAAMVWLPLFTVTSALARPLFSVSVPPVPGAMV